ncbi:probable DEAD-box ATP-dependent RNA helicase 48 [Spinacia oleracea]|uniref:Probable DEAD-box ATP-dependent RNA helicase 48 n=1 Tax=Spinacia oleracea TaxID=3562 RepID=A0A9R0JH55_SPIOL|nr:probable DEAD-box ATP-dependent RNA helicase 48 [Spinacia oleracea]
MQILQTSFPLSTPKPSPFLHSLSSSNSISPLSLLPNLSALSLTHRRPPSSTLIRMGGGPRTFPGGVSKWQWKRMQAKKAKQLLKARLSRERQIYEMRKRAELKAAVSDLERPWEVVQKGAPRTASSLFSVSADEQLKVLADRFQKPGGFDMWSDNDGPQIFDSPQGLPSARFFPKGVVHSIKPYGDVDEGLRREEIGNRKSSDAKGGIRKLRGGSNPKRKSSVEKGGIESVDRKRGDDLNGGDGNGRNLMNVRKVEGDHERRKTNSNSNSNVERSDKMKGYGRRQPISGRTRPSKGEVDVYDMSLQGDGRYGFSGSQNDDDLR